MISNEFKKLDGFQIFSDTKQTILLLGLVNNDAKKEKSLPNTSFVVYRSRNFEKSATFFMNLRNIEKGLCNPCETKCTFSLNSLLYQNFGRMKICSIDIKNKLIVKMIV